MSSRFVILQHTVGDSQHWDFMLEREGVLATWRLNRLPAQDEDRLIAATKINDHRLAYLEYEGPISGDRGIVRRVYSGEVVYAEITEDIWRFQLAGSSLNGSFQLVRKTNREWEFHEVVTNP